MKMKDADHPFFRPLWRRVAVVAVCGVWSGVEYFAGDPTWAMITAAIGAYGIWAFFINYNPGPAPEAGDKTG